jgi:hypothetical protein
MLGTLFGDEPNRFVGAELYLSIIDRGKIQKPLSVLSGGEGLRLFISTSGYADRVDITAGIPFSSKYHPL